MDVHHTGSALEREPCRSARTILSMAIAPSQPTLFNGPEDQGANQLFCTRVLSVAEPLLIEAMKLLSEALASTANFEIRQRTEGDVWLLQIVAIARSEFSDPTIQRLSGAAAEVTERLIGAIEAIRSLQPLTRTASTASDRLLDQVAAVKKRGIPTPFSAGLQVGYIGSLGALQFVEVQKRAKST